eukprot:10728558-Ditylum_brightwellii.AAC.1
MDRKTPRHDANSSLSLLPGSVGKKDVNIERVLGNGSDAYSKEDEVANQEKTLSLPTTEKEGIPRKNLVDKQDVNIERVLGN